jgi:hypothetical protein
MINLRHFDLFDDKSIKIYGISRGRVYIMYNLYYKE